MKRPAFDICIQGPFEPKVTLITDFVTVRVAGDETSSADVFVGTPEDAQQHIDAFTEAKALLERKDNA